MRILLAWIYSIKKVHPRFDEHKSNIQRDQRVKTVLSGGGYSSRNQFKRINNGETKLTWVWRQDHEIFREKKQRLERNEIPKEVYATAVMSWRHEMNQLRESIAQLVDYTRSAGSYCHNKQPNLT